MLVIRRRSGESLLVGDNVEVEILEVSGGQVKLGIRAPRDVSILRKEVYLTREQNRAAVESARSPRVQRWIDQLSAAKGHSAGAVVKPSEPAAGAPPATR